MADVLPSSVPRRRKLVFVGGEPYVRIACLNCGRAGGAVLEAGIDAPGGYVGYICDACAEVHSLEFGQCLLPDEVFAGRLTEAQLEAFGRELSPGELIVQLDDPSSVIAKLARDRARMKE
jgi:hypothetical protein